MTDQVQDTGTNTIAAGGTQNTDTTQVVGEGANKETTAASADVDYKFDTPEGMELNEGDLTEFKTIAKELKLSNDAAKKFVDLEIKRETARAEAFAKQVEDWGTQVKADPELGSAENLATAAKAIEAFGTPELKNLLNSTGMGNHPEVVRLALKVGKAISEDKIVAGRTGSNPPPRDAASVLYGTPN